MIFLTDEWAPFPDKLGFLQKRSLNIFSIFKKCLKSVDGKTS